MSPKQGSHILDLFLKLGEKDQVIEVSITWRKAIDLVGEGLCLYSQAEKE